MVPLHEARRRHARDAHCNFGGQGKYPRRRPHISSLRAVDHPPSTSICGVTNGCDSVDTFFTNTTGGLIVMAFKLYREGNKEGNVPAAVELGREALLTLSR